MPADPRSVEPAITPSAGVALVIGGSRGLGLATAKELAASGWAVAVTYSRDEQAAARAREILDELAPGRALVCKSDATSWTAASDMIETVESTLGDVTALVNNVGWGMLKSVEDTDPSFWRWMWSVNLESAVINATTVGRRMLERGSGAIVNMSAVSGMRAFERRAAHCVAKAGVNMLTQCLALEWGPRGVRTNAVAPGVVNTDYVRGMLERGLISEEAAIEHTPLRRLASEQEVATVVRFLVGSDASFVNGQIILVDGGWLVHGGSF
jgi:NAD(P)-dependent dehydrogenase (short-subunit alcohol dehydrogenase family)